MLEADLVLQGRYRIIEAIGRGGMGAVYLATDQTFGSTVAIKQTLCEGADLEKAFQREARLLNTLRHGALPVVIDYFTEPRGQFLVMQYIPGDDFGVLLEQRPEPFASALVVGWAEQLLDALQYLHEHDPQIIHRDIKPRNLKLTPRGEVVLLDFGLSKSTSVESHVAGISVSVLGYTPHYAPFEQIQGQGTDPRSDLFALAATLYHLLTATLPPDAMVRALTTMNGQADPLQPAHVANPAVPPAIGTVVHQAMAMARDQRPDSAAAMRVALKAASAGLLVAGAVAPVTSAAEAATVARAPSASIVVPAASGSTYGPRRWVAAAGVVGLVAVIGLAVALPGRNVSRPSAPPDVAEVVAAEAAAVDDAAGLITMAPAERTFAFDAGALGADGTVTRDPRQGRSYQEDLGQGEAIEMVAIPGGEFLMGSAIAEYSDEGPQHHVTVAPLYLSRYEVTQAQWRAVATTLPPVAHELDPDPSAFKGETRPVDQVSWDDATEFCERLSRQAHRRYRLPSEAEWEYVARAGTTTAFAFGDTLTSALANYDGGVPFGAGVRGSASTGTTPVGSYGVANGFGLYDMHGNVMEWCLGEYHSSYDGAPSDGRPWIANGDVDRHVLRGGSWDDLAVDCRSANRYSYPREGRQRTIGFRLAMSLAVPRGPTLMADPAAPDITNPVARPPLPRDLVVEGRGPRRMERPAARGLRPRLRKQPGD